MDWSGNTKSTHVCLGASNHANKEREKDDFYATHPKALSIFLDKLKSDGIEICRRFGEVCGQGHLSKLLMEKGYKVYSTDLIDRGFGLSGIDFLKSQNGWDGDILTNPPYKYAEEFLKKAMSILRTGNKCIMFLKIQFLESQGRRELFKKYPPKYVYVNSERQMCAMNGEFEKYKATALCYCWYIWEKGFTGDTIVRWI